MSSLHRYTDRQLDHLLVDFPDGCCGDHPCPECGCDGECQDDDAQAGEVG